MRVVVYILRSITSGKRYVGITNNLQRRIIEHRTGSTKAGQILDEFELIYTEEYTDYPSARKREKFLKSGQGRQWLDNTLPKHGPPEAGKAIP